MSSIKPLLILIGLAVFLAPLTAGAFGVSPPYINQHKLVPGSSYEATIHLVQGEPKEDLGIVAEFDVPEEIRSWFKVDKGYRFTIPAGVQQYPIKVSVNVPKSADLGIYSGVLRVKTTPPSAGGGKVAVSVGARIEINISVGDNLFIDFDIRKVDILDIRENEPVQVLIAFDNLGNVSIGPTRATFELFDKYGDIRLGFAQTENLPRIEAFSTKDFIVRFPMNLRLGPGEYWGEAKLYRDREIIGKMRNIFNVTEKQANPYLYLSIVLGLLVLAGVSVFVRKKFLKKQAKEINSPE